MPDPRNKCTQVEAEIWAAATEIQRIRERLRQKAGDAAEQELGRLLDDLRHERARLSRS